MNALTDRQNLQVYNSITKKKEVFKSNVVGKVGMYVCGPTVYSNVHLGNVRTFISFDVIYRYLLHLGYQVRYVRNITDAGHLENDADEGEDRIAKKARIEELEPMEIVQRYTLDFHTVLNRVNNLPPSIEPTATGHIIEQIQLIKKILEKGLAYEVNGSIYFDVLAYNKENDYGILSGRKIEEAIHNTRVLDGQSEKKNPQDFALWKKAEKKHIMRWPSPWGEGFPGWHLECTSMSTKYLGTSFDIHGGGMDLKFPHHECEIAQAQAANNQNPVNYWLHANMLTLNGQKMAKSTGNHILPNELFSGDSPLISKAFSPEVTRFFILQAHYRSILDFSNEALAASEKGFTKLMTTFSSISSIEPSKTTSIPLESWINRCYSAMNDDFNTPILIAHLFDAIKYINLIHEGKETILEEDKQLLKETMESFIFDVLGLKSPQKTESITLNETVEVLISLRNQARENRNWELSDSIRDQLAEIGVILKDGKEKTTFNIQ